MPPNRRHRMRMLRRWCRRSIQTPSSSSRKNRMRSKRTTSRRERRTRQPMTRPLPSRPLLLLQLPPLLLLPLLLLLLLRRLNRRRRKPPSQIKPSQKQPRSLRPKKLSPKARQRPSPRPMQGMMRRQRMNRTMTRTARRRLLISPKPRAKKAGGSASFATGPADRR